MLFSFDSDELILIFDLLCSGKISLDLFVLVFMSKFFFPQILTLSSEKSGVKIKIIRKKKNFFI